ncbi:glycosyltransferase family 2 protein [Bacteroides reticulotermitis]|uniref:Glycosyltransferase n=2 Tax=Bacteroides reticulotermitis TaxID=1133319 RepID=W4UXM0_9BACE|nr:glycosyltransferase family A protein [Bacteroides reticulotermitis]MBB4044806.1 glycosyltransferase involved in cell wall biosynthesis [Bacteroides reticulotermitis]GAE85567.1 glycosyltransferase [Bacteroides reticulotermitis JCM 10512]
MSKWFEKYLTIYEKPFGSVPQDIISSIERELKTLNTHEQPLVSVVLICYNEELHLTSCLWSLVENQCSFPIEILAVNNHSSDGTEQALKTLGVTYFNEEKKGPGHARQCGLDHAKGTYHLCIDADTIYPPHYIETHVKALMKPGVAATFSLWSFMPQEGQSKLGLWCYETLRDIYLNIQAINRPELCVRGMTFGFHTVLGRHFGFRTDIRRGEDGSLALAMKPHGKLVFIRSKKARVMTGNGTLNTDGSLANSFKLRVVKGLKGLSGLFTSQKKYEDKDNNMIKK